MTLGVRAMQKVLGTGTTEDFAVTGFSTAFGTAKAALQFGSWATAVNSAVSEAVFYFGGCDATREGSAGGYAQHGNANSVCFRSSSSSDILLAKTAVGTDFVNTFSSFIDDTPSGGDSALRVTTTTNTTRAPLLTTVLFGGSDLSVYQGALTTSGSVDGTAVTTAPGFEPDQIIFWTAYQADGGNNGNAVFSLGFADWDGVSTISQASMNQLIRTSEADGLAVSEVSNDRVSVLVWPGASNFAELEVTAVSSTGFTVTTRNSTTGAAQPLYYLALNYGGTKAHSVGTITTPTSTGTQAYTGWGCQPDFILMPQGYCTTVNTKEDDNADAGSAGVGVACATGGSLDEEFSTSWADENISATTDTQSMTDSKISNMPLHDGTASTSTSFLAAVSAIGTDGATLNFTNTPSGEGKIWPYMAFGDAPAGGGPSKAILRRRRDASLDAPLVIGAVAMNAWHTLRSTAAVTRREFVKRLAALGLRK